MIRNTVVNATKVSIVALVACIALVCAGCVGGLVSGSIESRIEDSLPGIIGPADSYKVDVSGSSRKMIRGRFREIKIHGEAVKAVPGLTLDRLDVVLRNVEADTKTGALKHVDAVEFKAALFESSLNRYLAGRPDKLKVQLLNGKILANARPKKLGISANVSVMGRLSPSGGGRLDLNVERFKVAGVKVPSFGAKALEDRINPVVDVAPQGFMPNISAVKVTQEAVLIEGTADISSQVELVAAK